MRYRFIALFLLPILGVTALLFQNCSAPDVSMGTAANSSSSTAASNYSVYPSEATVSSGAQQPFMILGGTPPYSWALSPANCGSFNTDTKIYTAPANSAICTLSIRDNANLVVRAVIQVASNTLSATYSPNPAALNSPIQVSGVGGTPGYSYQLQNGQGALYGPTYITSVVETAAILVTDAAGQSFVLNIPIGMASASTGGTQTVYVNLLNNDYFSTVSSTEGPSSGYSSVGTVSLYSTPSASRTNVRRCFSVYNGHSAELGSCSGGGDEGSLGYVDSVAASGSKAIFSCSNGYSPYLTSSSSGCSARGLSPSQVGFGP